MTTAQSMMAPTMIALLETETKHGGISPAEVRQQLSENDENGFMQLP